MHLKKILFLSFLTHFIIISFRLQTHNFKKNKDSTIIFKIKKKSRTIKKIKSKGAGKFKVSTNAIKTFKGLSVVRGNKDFSKEAEVNEHSNAISTSEGLQIFKLIDQELTYPQEFSILGMQGYVFVDAYFDENGKFNESKSRFSFSNKLLSIHVRQILRRSLKNVIRISEFSPGYYRLNFSFITSTTHNSLAESLIQTGNIDFYRKNYGVINNMDKFNNSLNRILIGATNWLSLLDYLPGNQESQRARILKFLESLKNDPKW